VVRLKLKLPPFRFRSSSRISLWSGCGRATMKKKRLGEVLRERGQVSAADLNEALQDQQGKVIHLGELLLRRGLVSKNDLISALAEISRIPYLDCTSAQVDPAALKLIPHAMAKRCSVLPLAIEESGLLVVMAEPQNLHMLDEIRFKTGMEIVPQLGFAEKSTRPSTSTMAFLSKRRPLRPQSWHCYPKTEKLNSSPPAINNATLPL
jgi:hypothetical protein